MNVKKLPRQMAVRVLRRTNGLGRYFELRRWVRARRGRIEERIGPPRRLKRAQQEAGGVVCRHRGAWWLAQRTSFIAATEARDTNLDTVVTFLRHIGVEHFFVPIDDQRQFRIGVDLRHRDDVIAGLRDYVFPSICYLRPAGFATQRLVPVVNRDRVRELEASLAGAHFWWFWSCYTDDSGFGFIGPDVACQLEFWSPRYPDSEGDQADENDLADDERDEVAEDSATELADDDDAVEPTALRAGRPNPLTSRIDVSTRADTDIEIGGVVVPAPYDFARFHASRVVPFPVDLVYTWVDDADPAWQSRRNLARGGDATHNRDGSIEARYRNRDELRYSLRSVAMYAPFVRHIFLVTDRQRPDWLDADAEGLTIVDHSDIFDDSDRLPTFNSHAIESRLHRIEGLAEHYVYVNDDVFFGQPVFPTTFFTRTGLSMYFPSKARLPVGPAHAGEPSVTSAAKNGRDLLFKEFGLFPMNKMKHTPHPQRRSTVVDLEQRYPEAMQRVGRNQFRSATDIPVASWLQHYHGEAIGQAVRGSIRYNYLSLTADNLPDRLESLATGNYDTWCLNDVSVEDTDAVDELLGSFLKRTFPWKSPWEISV